MIDAYIQLQKLVKSISIKNKILEPIIHKYTFYLVQEQMEENEQNQLIFQNFKKSNVIIIDKFDELFSKIRSEYFIIGFENIILLVINRESIQLLKNLFISKKDLKICFLNKTKSIFDQNCIIPYTSMTYNKKSLDTEIEFFSQSLETKEPFKNRMMKTWKIISKSISAYMIEKAYCKLAKNRVSTFFNDQNKHDAIFPFQNEIKSNDYIKLRPVHNGSNFLIQLIYHIEREELFILKILKPGSKKNANREIANYPKIKHPFIPKYIGKTIDNELVIEFINGQNLEDYDFINSEDIARIIIQLMIVVEFLHHNHYIIRDLEPNHIMIDEDKNIVLNGFESMIKKDTVIENNTSDFSSYAATEINEVYLSYESDIESIGKIIKSVLEKPKNANEMSKYFDDICKSCTNNNNKCRPSIYGMIRFINDYFNFQNHDVYFQTLLQLNRTLAIQCTNDDVNDPYKQIILGFIYLEESYDINKRNYAKNNYEKAKNYFEMAKKYGFVEAEFILIKLMENETKSSSLSKSIYRYSKDFQDDEYENDLDEYENEFNLIIKNFDFSIFDKFANPNHPFIRYCVGLAYLGLVENFDLNENIFNIFSITDIFQYKDYCKIRNNGPVSINEIKEIIKPDIKKGIYHIAHAAKKNSIEAKLFLGILHLANGYKFKTDENNANLISLLKMVNIDISFITRFIKIFNECGSLIKFKKEKGIEYLTDAANYSRMIQYLLGVIYFEGKFVTKNIERAMHYLTLSAYNKYVIAQHFLGYIYYMGKEVKQDINKSIYYFDLSAQQNYPIAQCSLGILYLDLETKSFNIEKAIYYLDLASKNGIQEAQLYLGIIYAWKCVYASFNRQMFFLKSFFPYTQIIQKMHSISKSFPDKVNEGISLLQKAAKQNNIVAQILLVIMHYKNPCLQTNMDIIEIYGNLASKNNPDGSLYLGIIYYDLKDYKKALKYLSLCSHNPLAQTLIGIININNNDFQNGINSLQQAANQNFSWASFLLGQIYSNSFCTKPDFNKAFNYFTQAANDGLGPAEYELSLMYFEGTCIKQDLPKAFNLLMLSSEKLYYLSFSSIGSLYHKGFFVNQDISEAIHYYKEGSNKNDPYSKSNLAMLCKYGFKDQIPKSICDSIVYLEEAIRINEESVSEYNLAHIHLYEKVDNDIDKAVELMIESELQFPHSSMFLCLALVMKYNFIINDIENALSTNIHKDTILRMIRSKNLIDQHSFNQVFEQYRDIDFIYDHMKQPIKTSKFYEIQSDLQRQNITKDFLDGFGEL